jgi:hypothetical protein
LPVASIALASLDAMAASMFGNLVKAVVDTEPGSWRSEERCMPTRRHCSSGRARRRRVDDDAVRAAVTAIVDRLVTP